MGFICVDERPQRGGEDKAVCGGCEVHCPGGHRQDVSVCTEYIAF